jgi:adenylosuccinate lyase
MGCIWTEENKVSKWLQVELCVCEVLADRGKIPRAAFERIRERARFDVARMQEIERTTKHDVVAFITNVGESIGEDSRYFHLGLTSSDILDTGLALQLVEAADLILEGLEQLGMVMREQAWCYKDTPMIGRTHGIHAEPITFGLKLANWYAEVGRAFERMRRAREMVAYGKLSGAVGTFAHTEPSLEEEVCSRLGLRAAPISSQVVQRDRHAEYVGALALVGASLEKFALEIRHLQRTEVQEAEEFFTAGQRGSSAMPHKRNPIVTEQVCGLARLLRAHAMAALENVALWHERDISHSSVERVILPDSTILVDYLLHRFIALMQHLIVYEERMRQNLEGTGGLIYSQRLLVALEEAGVPRERAYELVQRPWRRGSRGGTSMSLC